jgi:hypothetical protein
MLFPICFQVLCILMEFECYLERRQYRCEYTGCNKLYTQKGKLTFHIKVQHHADENNNSDKDTLDTYSEQLFDFQIFSVPSNLKFLIVA